MSASSSRRGCAPISCVNSARVIRRIRAVSGSRGPSRSRSVRGRLQGIDRRRPSLVFQDFDIVALRSVATRFRGSVRSSATSSSTNTLILFPLRSVATRSKGKRRHSLSRADVATFNTDVVMRAERFVYYSGPSFVFKQDGVVVDGGAMEWLRRTGDDTRGGKKRGVVNVAKSTWRRPPRRP